MNHMRKLFYAALMLSSLTFSGCALNKMMKAAEEQSIEVTPNPLELHGGEVAFTVDFQLPAKMLKDGITYSVNPYYVYGDKEIALDAVEFKAADYPNSDTEPVKTSQEFSFEFEEGMTTNGELMMVGTATIEKNDKSKSTERKQYATGIITTSNMVEPSYFAAYASHGYNDKEELVPTNINFYFAQGSSVLSPSISTDGTSNSKKQRELSAFIAEKNVTRTVTITGTHSPEGSERINSGLSNDRAKRIEDYYRRQMRRYDYKGMADSIKFILKPVVENWNEFRSKLSSYDGISDDAKAQMRRVIDGTGSFEDKENQLQKIDGYKKVFNDIYPDLRAARTEILTVKEKKAPAEIAVLAKQIVDGTASADTLSNEEFLYAATLTPSLKEKEAIYLAATKRDGSWVAHNNLAAVYLDMARSDADNRAKLVEDALTQLEIAANKKSSPEVHANMASAYTMQKEYAKAYESLGKAESGASNALKSEINGMKGAIEIRMAQYDNAKASLVSAKNSDVTMFNRGLVNLLTGDFNGAINSFNGATDGSIAADAYYYSAVASARGKNPTDVIKSLKEAVTRDSSLKDKALNDLEFVNFADAVAQAVR